MGVLFSWVEQSRSLVANIIYFPERPAECPLILVIVVNWL
ncbi:hypothetical protein AVDCRST_MAG92-1072 [uncultured Coleofasciculus sp.]|uniref:Uncharacterized protein n=1 Tax=uncultured Coleofasciculus sp. TaxID=1267456 RepID=A0A6J4HSX5_9CYAN|nr:hypothetical protein AVDCRST_MAG92-1072 [uncultured Coleofasciculus sp.]